jgi:hypothetical protein
LAIHGRLRDALSGGATRVISGRRERIIGAGFEDQCGFCSTPGVEASFKADGGAEFLVLEGSAEESGDALRRHSWVRIPDGGTATLKAGKGGMRIWLETGHLRHVVAP